MIKKLTLSLIMIASLVFFAGAAMTAFAEDGRDGDSQTTISADATVSVDDNGDDSDNDQDSDTEDSSKDGSDDSQSNNDGDKSNDNAWFRGRADVREQRTELRQEHKGLFNIFRSEKEDAKQTMRGLIESRWKMIGVRFENIITRIDSRIAKLEAAGKDVASAKDHLSKAKASITDAQVKAQALADAATAGTLTKDAVMKVKVDIKADLENAKAELKLSVQAIIALQPAKEDAKENN